MAVAAALFMSVAIAVGPSQASPSEPEATPIAVLAGTAPEGLAVAREGLGEYIRDRLGAISLEVEPGSQSRARGRELGSRTAELLRASAEAGAGQALIFDIDNEDGELVTRMRLYALEDATLFGIASEPAADGALAQAADRGLASLLKRLGSDRKALPRGQKFELEELAAISRSLTLLDRGDRVKAWKTLSNLRGRGAAKMRRRIEREAEANQSEGPAEIARLQLARGDADGAWELLGPRLEELGDEIQDAALNLAAGEVQLERGRMRDAKKHLEKAYELAPDDPDALLGMARFLALSNDPAAASRLFDRAAELDTESAEPLELNARLAAENADLKAQLFLEAGRRKARYLDTEGVQQSFGSAVRIDPRLAPVTSDAAGQMYSALQRHELATDAYRSVIDLDGENAERLERLAAAQRLMGDVDGSIASYENAIELAPDRAALHEGIGRAHQANGSHTRALEHLSSAADLAPGSAAALVAMAEVQEQMGDPTAALATYGKAKERGILPARALRSEGGLLRKLGDHAGAEQSLRAAIEVQPADPKLRTELAAILRESGDAEAATLAERLALDWVPTATPTEIEELAGDEPEPASLTAANDLEELVLSFGPPSPELQTTMLIGIREQATPTEQAIAWLMPKRIALGALEERVLLAISKFYPVTSRDLLARQTEGLRATAEELFDFEAKSSLSSASIATVNRQLATDAVFVASVSLGGPAQQACGEGGVRMELRRLAGTTAEEIDALGNGICLGGGLVAYATWNYPAFAGYALLLALILFPIVRGWGSAYVKFTFPKNTKLEVGVRVSRWRRAPVKMDDSGDNALNKFKLQDRINSAAFFEKRLKGDTLVFDWLAARRKPYYVTVRGPMVDATSGELIGMYQEERTIMIRRGKQTRIEFDMRIKEAALEIRVVQDRQLAAKASVSLEGVKDSLRYCNGKPTYHYLDVGRYTLLIAGPDRVLREPLEISALAPIHKTIDLDDERLLVFKDCADAVEPYLVGNLEAAADALEAAGQIEPASNLRAQSFKAAGNTVAAAETLEKAGKLDEAARLHAQGGDHTRAAVLLQESGDNLAAARAHREAGDLPAAARAFEAAEDWSNAIECYRQLQDPEGLLNALERGQSYFEAGQRAEEAGQIQRALHNYQRLTYQDTEYGATCLQMGRILEAQNEPELARERYAAALEGLGEEMPLDAHFRLAELLEEEGQIEQAIGELETIRRRNHEYSHAKTKLEELRKVAEQTQAQKPAPVQPSAGDRYEIVSELGRGGMGVVYRATDTHLGRVIALKKLPENLKDHPTAVELFLREARSAAVLNHSNVVTVYDAGQDGDNYFISMECLEGIPLDALLKEARSTLCARRLPTWPPSRQRAGLRAQPANHPP